MEKTQERGQVHEDQKCATCARFDGTSQSTFQNEQRCDIACRRSICKWDAIFGNHLQEHHVPHGNTACTAGRHRRSKKIFVTAYGWNPRTGHWCLKWWLAGSPPTQPLVQTPGCVLPPRAGGREKRILKLAKSLQSGLLG